MAKQKTIALTAAHERKLTTDQKLELMFRNVEAMRLFYRKQKDPGREVGHVVMHELIFSNLSRAMELALSEKEWTENEVEP